MKRIFSLSFLLAALFLSACGPNTRLITEIDAMTLIPEDETQGSSVIDSSLDLKIPDDNGFSSEDLGLSEDTLASLVSFNLHVVTELSLAEDDSPMDVTMGLYLNDVSPAFASSKPFEVKARLEPGMTTDAPLSIVMNEKENPELFKTLKSGKFFLGISYLSTGEEGQTGTLSAKLKSLDFSFIADVNDLSGF